MDSNLVDGMRNAKAEVIIMLIPTWNWQIVNPKNESDLPSKAN